MRDRRISRHRMSWAVGHALAFAGAAGLTVQAQSVIKTVAGGGPQDLPALEAAIGGPYAVALDCDGNLYISVGESTRYFLGCPIAYEQSNRVFKVDSSGKLTIAAGAGVRAFSGDMGPPTHAGLFFPLGLAADEAGNLYISDTDNRRIRRIDAVTGIITTVAGNGTAVFSGDGGPAISAGLGLPAGIATDGSGNLFIADIDHDRLRRVNTATGIITTVAGNGVSGFSGDGGPATAASLDGPTSVAVDAAGNILIVDRFNHRIRRVAASNGFITTVAGIGGGYAGDGGPATLARMNYPWGVALDSAGNLYISDTANGRIRRVDPLTGIITSVFVAPAFDPHGLVATESGILFVADRSNARVVRVDPATGAGVAVAGNGSFGFSGDGGPATHATFDGIAALAVHGAVNLIISDSASVRIRHVDLLTGTIDTVAGNGTFGFSGDGGPATSAGFRAPRGVALDAAGNLFIADKDDHRVRRVDASTDVIDTFAGTGVNGHAGEGGRADRAQLSYPESMAIDGLGNVYIGETFDCEDPIAGNRIRRVDSQHGRITTVAGTGARGFSGDGGLATAAELNIPGGIALDAGGDLFIADTFNHRIRRVDAATGIITTVAGNGLQGFEGDGGLAINARLSLPSAVAVDAAGSILIGDAMNDRVRRVDASTGIISTVIGTGLGGFGGDTGPAGDALLDNPAGLALDPAGTIFIADRNNNRVRRVSGEPVAAGSVSDKGGASGKPLVVTLDPSGNVELSWDASCVGSDTDYEVYEGGLGDFTSHLPLFCSTGGARAVTFPPSSGDVYYLVVPRNILREGSYGFRGDGSPRPPSSSACALQAVGACE